MSLELALLVDVLTVHVLVSLTVQNFMRNLHLIAINQVVLAHDFLGLLTALEFRGGDLC